MSSISLNWASPPGDTIKDLLQISKTALDDFYFHLGLSEAEGIQLLRGDLRIDQNLAGSLSQTLGSTAKFWINREAQYLEDKSRLEENYLAKSWMSVLPLCDMVKKRWINPSLRGQAKLDACLKYFNVNSFSELSVKYEGILHTVAFRTSDSFDSIPESIITWLRQGEIQYEKLDLDNFDSDKLSSSLTEIRKLTLEPDPTVFLPKLRDIFSKCGIALAIAPAPKGCRASGAVYFVNDFHAIILLSFRYLSDDHFWFTLFHECGHLLLHRDNGLLLEGASSNITEIEEEANSFASELLIPPKYEKELQQLHSRNLRGILKFAKKVGVSKGIVIGQLQKRGLVSYKYLNKLKVRYRW